MACLVREFKLFCLVSWIEKQNSFLLVFFAPVEIKIPVLVQKGATKTGTIGLFFVSNF